VAAGLLANATCQSRKCWPNHGIREQARSHKAMHAIWRFCAKHWSRAVFTRIKSV